MNIIHIIYVLHIYNYKIKSNNNEYKLNKSVSFIYVK